MRSTRIAPWSCRRGSIALPLLLACSGCIERRIDGDVTTYGYETWVVLAVGVGGIVAAPVGWALRKWIARLGYILMILGPLAAILVAPAMWTERVVVDANHFEHSAAVPGSNDSSVPFDDVAALHYRSAVEGSGRRSRRNHRLDVTRKDGRVQTIDLGTLYQEAVGEIFKRAAARGIRLSEDHQ